MEHGKLEAANSKSRESRYRVIERKRPKSAKYHQIPALRSDDWNFISSSRSARPLLSVFPALLPPFDLEMTTVPFSDDGIGIANLPNQVSCDTCFTQRPQRETERTRVLLCIEAQDCRQAGGALHGHGCW